MLQPQRLQRLLTTSYCGRDLWQVCQTPSTNQILWRRWQRGGRPGMAVVATRQLAGQGQWGRPWHSDPGGLYLSLLLGETPDPQASLLTLGLTLAWSVAVALETWQPTWQGLQVKWPNDLVWQGAKVGGLLVQTRSGSGSRPLAVGIGLNVNNQPPPPGLALKAILGSRVDLTAVAAVVIGALEQGFETWHNRGWSRVQHHYQAKLWTGTAMAQVNAAGLLEINGVTYAPGEFSLGYKG
ncbi:MAG: biotin--[acetyl-CoA-carboxylase] ligase [Thermostichales cyanobacterium SZTDM-1c_bins_54]